MNILRSGQKLGKFDTTRVHDECSFKFKASILGARETSGIVYNTFFDGKFEKKNGLRSFISNLCNNAHKASREISLPRFVKREKTLYS